MKQHNLALGSLRFKALTAVMLLMGVTMLSSCDDDGLSGGDPDYFTSSRGQFTATLDDGTTLFLIPGSTANTATVTYDGSNPQHWRGATDANVEVTTYTGDFVLNETVTADDGKTYRLTSIGDEAFMGNRSLTTLTLPESIQSFGEAAFAVCTQLTAVNIPEGITEIPLGCFGHCTSLREVNLPSTVKSLSKMAFYGCAKITSVSLPEGLESIGEMAFFDCPGSGFTQITIPSTVKTIGNLAFGGRDGSSRSKIEDYYVKSTTPPTLEGELYQAASGVEPIIHVPSGTGEAYRNAPGWSSLNIMEE